MAERGFTPAPVTTIVSPEATFDAGPMVNVSDFDPVDILPAAAADKLRALRQRANDLHGLVPAFEQISDVGLEKIKADRELKRLSAAAHEGGYGLPETDNRVVAARRRLGKLADEAQRLQELREVRTAAWQTTARTLGNVETWLNSGRPGGNTVLELFEGPEPKLLKGESLTDAILRLQRRCRELMADAHTIRSAPFPASYAKRKLREEVEQWAQRGEPNVAGLIEHDGNTIEFRTQLTRVSLHNIPKAPAAVGYTEAIDVIGLLAWLAPDLLIKRLDFGIDSEADDKAALTPEERQRREAETLSDLLAAERDECSLIWAAQAQNLPCEFRADVNPVALLGLKLVTRPHAVPSLGSSIEHAFGMVGR